MKRSQNVLLLAVAFMGLLSCENETRRSSDDTREVSYELIKRDSLMFRRAYWGQDTLEGKEWEMFMNRNPESCEDFSDSKKHPLYTKLIEANIILDENLNPSEIDTLPNTFYYQISTNKKVKVVTSTVYDPELVDAPGHALRFFDGDKCIFADTIEYGFPPDVTFFTRDLENDGSHELISLFRWYIVNGDNYDLMIYNLKEKP